MNMQKVLRQARDLEVHLAENYITEIACRPFSSYIVNFQARTTELDPRSELSPAETKVAQEAVVNFYHEMG
jgi:hypothetical protein